jgi:hypothetical protein
MSIAGMALFGTVLLWIVGGIMALYVFFGEILDNIGRAEIIENRWPGLWKILNKRLTRWVAILFLLILVGKDILDRANTKHPEYLQVVMPSFPAPLIQMVQPTGRNSTITNPKPSSSVTVSAPNGIAVGGGTVNNPTVNNYAPPARRLDSAEKAALISCLTLHPGTVGIQALMGDAEAFGFANDWLEVFRDAKWKIDDGVIRSFIPVGAARAGTELHFHGSINPDGTNLQHDSQTASGAAADCLLGKPVYGGAKLIPTTDVPLDHVSILIGQEVRPE